MPFPDFVSRPLRSKKALNMLGNGSDATVTHCPEAASVSYKLAKSMPLVPNDWNVVVIGHWNRAILSPAGIAKRLFGLPEGTPIEVMVPLEVVAPYHVRHKNITVIPSSDRLVVSPVQCTFENLVEAIGIIRKALEDLPRTPVFAVGINVRYISTTEVDVLQQSTASAWDDKLSDKRLIIASRSIMRSVHWRDGTINITIKVRSGRRLLASLQLRFQVDFD